MKTLIFSALYSYMLFQSTGMFNKLIGTWKMKTSQGVLYETWRSDNANQLSGMTYIVNGKDSSVFERMTISMIDKNIYYTANVTGQNSGNVVRFSLAGSIGNYYMFENKQHDFPQRVIYEFVSADSIHARIEGTENGRSKAEDFYYSRVK